MTSTDLHPLRRAKCLSPCTLRELTVGPLLVDHLLRRAKLEVLGQVFGSLGMDHVRAMADCFTQQRLSAGQSLFQDGPALVVLHQGQVELSCQVTIQQEDGTETRSITVSTASTPRVLGQECYYFI